MIRAAVLLALALVLVPTAAAAQLPDPAGADVTDFFTPEEIARADAYRGPRYAIAFTSIAVGLVTLGLMGLGAGARSLASWSERLTGGRHAPGGRWVRRAGLLTAVVTVVPSLVSLPLALVRHRHDVRFGLATDTVPSFLRDVGVGMAIELLISLVAAVLFLWAARRRRRAWPVIVAAGGAAFTLLLVFLFPLVFEPAFNTFRPVDAPTRARVLALADRAGVQVQDVLVADASRRTSAHNAYVSGIGATRRAVLYDTLLAGAPPNEVDLVVAHELGHVVHDDVRNGALLGAAGVAVGAFVLWVLLRRRRLLDAIGATAPGDPAVIPFLAFFLAVSSIVTLPLQNAISRGVEARADRTAIVLTSDPVTAVAVEVRLARQNIADLTPNAFVRWMFFSHPATMERIKAALEAAR